MDLWIIAKREIKLGFRNPWAYSFLALFSLFALALLVIQSQSGMEGYTHTTGSLLNLILYLLPLMTLLLGSFSVTSEKEEGGWQLLSTYSLSSYSYLAGKYIGQAIVLIAIVACGYGFSGVIGFILGKTFTLSTLVLFLSFSVLLVLLYLSIAILMGTFSENRWEALTYGVAVWFFTIIGWSTLLIAVLGKLPYLWIKPGLVFLTFINPAELVRVFMVIKMGGGAVFGPEYYQWIGWIRQPSGTPIFILVCLLWIGIALGAAIFSWERGRRRG